jgi:hypothetical protein
MESLIKTANVIGFGQVDREILKDLQSKGCYFDLVYSNGDKDFSHQWVFNTGAVPGGPDGYLPSDTITMSALKDVLDEAKQKDQEAIIKSLSEQADAFGYTLVKKEVKAPWKFHDYNLNDNPEDLLKVKAGDIVKFKTYYFLVKIMGGAYYLTMIDFQKDYVSPSDIGIIQGTYPCVHVRDGRERASGAIQWLYGLIKSGEYVIS